MAEKKSKIDEVKKLTKDVKKPKQRKPYVHIDTFLQTAIPMFKLNSIQAQGFKTKMAGKHYQRDEGVFLEELKKHFKL